MKETRKTIEVATSDDVRVSLQLSTPRIFNAIGEREGEPEVVLLLEDPSSPSPDEWMATAFNHDQLCILIDALGEMRMRLAEMRRK